MSPEAQFITDQLEAIKPQIANLKIMQLAWEAGGDVFKPQLDDVSKKLGSWLAVKDNLEKQLSELNSN